MKLTVIDKMQARSNYNLVCKVNPGEKNSKIILNFFKLAIKMSALSPARILGFVERVPDWRSVFGELFSVFGELFSVFGELFSVFGEHL